MNINVTDQSQVEHVPVRIVPCVKSPAEIVAEIVRLLECLDSATFRLAFKCAKQIRRGNRIVAVAESKINGK